MNPLAKKRMNILIEAAQDGSREAFEGIFNNLSNKLFAFASVRTSSRDDALDVVQETFIDLWKAIPGFSYQSDEQFYGFVFKIARRKLYKYYKDKKCTVPLDETTDVGYEEMNPRDFRYMLRELGGLSEKYRELIHLRYWSGMSFSEIAQILDVREGTAKVWHHRAIKKLQVTMQKYENR